MHALVVDDSRAMRSILSPLMNGLGLRGFPGGGRRRSARGARGRRPAPTSSWSDWYMPVMDGLTFIKTVRGP
jgi:two-component system chemotaxis response regulator CheY